MAVSAAMYSTLRTEVLPPAMVLRPRIRLQSRLIGATPTRAANWWRPMVPNSGSSARRVRAVTSPMPGTDFRRASASRPNRRGLDCLADVAVDLGELFLQEDDM